MARKLPVIAVSVLIGWVCAYSRATPSTGAAEKKEAIPVRKYVELKSGVYDCELTGMVCLACADMAKNELLRIRGVMRAEIDFDARLLRIEIKPKHVVAVNTVKRALARAARRIDLGTTFVLGDIRYVP